VGGLKVARVMMVVRQGLREVRQLVHPKGQFLVKMGGRRVSESVVLSVSGFITLWMCCFMALMLGMNATGLDLISAFGGTVATLANLGPGLGSVTSTFADASPATVWIGTLGMLLGRLEVFSVLVLLTPSFWRE
jgi:trk system potassium uptake protein TrkH